MSITKPFYFGLLLQAPAVAANPQSRIPANPFDIDRIASHVGQLEAAGFDLVLLADTLDMSEAAFAQPVLGLEAFTQASYIASKTRHIGLAVSANTNYLEPFSLARLLASLDHVSHGRAGWLVTSTDSGNSARNHQVAPAAEAARWRRRRESIATVEGLFDTWEDDAFVRDKDSGRFVDTAKVHFLNHRGEHFAVKGPLNVARPPQGHLPKLTYFAGEHACGADPSHGHDYQGLLLAGLAEDEAWRLRESLATTGAGPRLFNLVVPLIAESRGAAVQEFHAHLESIVLDKDILRAGQPAAYWRLQQTCPAADGVMPSGWRNLSALSIAAGYDFTAADADDIIDPATAAALAPRGRQLLRIARLRQSLLQDASATPAAASVVRVIDLLRAHVDPREIFAGTPADWRAQVAAWASPDSPYDGVLLAPAARHFLDDEFVRALATALPPPDDGTRASAPLLLNGRLGLPRPANTFTLK